MRQSTDATVGEEQAQDMPLTPIEKDEVIQSVDIEIGNMFDRLSNHYSNAEHGEQALLLPELELHIKAGLLDHTTV